jgi:hypothetical protein
METLGNTQFENIFGAGPRDRIAVAGPTLSGLERKASLIFQNI